MKNCLRTSCKETVTNDMFTCRKHWLELPATIRKGLVRASAQVRKNAMGTAVEVPENEVLMKAVRGLATEHWKMMDRKVEQNATT